MVLIVDDSLVARLAITSALKDCGAELAEAPSGEEALRLVASGFAADLVFLDLTMPGLGGVETLRRLRGQAMPPRVIVVTADIQARTLAEVADLGAFRVLPKPADPEDVRRVFAEALREVADGAGGGGAP